MGKESRTNSCKMKNLTDEKEEEEEEEEEVEKK